MANLSRRDFLRAAALVGAAGATGGAAALLGPACRGGPGGPAGLARPSDRSDRPDSSDVGRMARPFQPRNALDRRLAVVKGDDPEAMVARALALLGGIGQLVAPGDLVVLKANICTDQPPKVAATTNPRIVAALVRLCLEAGAREVRVIDHPSGNEADRRARAYETSGIQSAVEATARELGAADKVTVPRIRPELFRAHAIAGATFIREAAFYGPALEADVLINLPVLKNHSGAVVALGLKNLMGLIRDRTALHPRIQEGIVDINRPVGVDLTILDALRGMKRGGPHGRGRAEYVEARTVVAGVDRVALDAWALPLLGLDLNAVGQIREADGVLPIPGGEKGTTDWKKRGIVEGTV